MQGPLFCLTVLFVLLVSGAVGDEVTKSSETQEKQAMNCREAGWTRCCRRGECLALGGQCFCDHSCHEFGDCCDDIDTTCPKTAPKHVCVEGKVRLIKGELRICKNDTFHNICDLPKESLSQIDLLQGHNHHNIVKRQNEGSSGDGVNINVEVGFTACEFNTSESDANVLVCVEVKAGQLTPAESVTAILSTKPGTAQGDVDYESKSENIIFDGNTMRDPFCVEIAIIDDVIFESVEYFSVSLRGMTPGMTMDETSLSAKVFITDAGPIAPGDSCAAVGQQNECCTTTSSCPSHNLTCSCDNLCFSRRDCCEDIFGYAVEMEKNEVFVNEGNTAQVCVVLTGRFDTTTEDIVLNTIITKSELTDEEDYQISGGGEIVFHANDLQEHRPGDSLTQCVEISATNNTHLEGERTLAVEIVSDSLSSVVLCSASNSTVVHIIDDDVAEMSLVAALPTLQVVEDTPLNVCVRVSSIDHTNIPLAVNITLHSEQGSISSVQARVPVGELADGQTQCYNVTIDNDILEVIPWELTVALHTAATPSDTYIRLTTPSSLTLSVSDDEVDSVWVQFESPDIKVTGGHRTVACVILGGLPRGGMILDIFATLNLVNNTSGYFPPNDVGRVFELGDGRGTEDSLRLVFHSGDAVDTRQCLVVDTYEVLDTIQFNLSIAHTDPPVNIRQPSNATVSIQAVYCTIPVCVCSRPFYLMTLLAVLTGVSLLILLVIIVAFCCYCRRSRSRNKQHQKAMIVPPLSERSMTIHNQRAEESTDTDNRRTKTMTSFGSATCNSFRTHRNSEEREKVQQRNRVIRSMVLSRDSDNESEDYLDLQPAGPATITGGGMMSSVQHHYEEPVFKSQPSATLL